MLTLNISGEEYTFDPSKDHILKRGLIDPYDLSPNANEWVVLKEYIFWSARIQQPIIVPKYMITDLSSIPRLFRWMISVNERHRIASLPHDLLYVINGFFKGRIDRETADLIFLDFCTLMEVGKLKRYTMYYAVRAGGWIAFDGESDMFIPLQHRAWYDSKFPDLDLGLEAGSYIIPDMFKEEGSE